MNYREVVDDMRDECQTAEDTGLFNTILFNYDGWLNGEKLRVTAQMERSNPVLYRGWMMKPEEYQNLYVELEIRGIHQHAPFPQCVSCDKRGYGGNDVLPRWEG